MKKIIKNGRLVNLIELTYPKDAPEWAVEFDIGFTIITRDRISAERLYEAVEKYGKEAWSDRSI